MVPFSQPAKIADIDLLFHEHEKLAAGRLSPRSGQSERTPRCMKSGSRARRGLLSGEIVAKPPLREKAGFPRENRDSDAC